MAALTGRRLIRLQCYEGLDEAKALYEWNYSKQLLRIQAERTGHERADWSELQADIFGEEFLLARPLLAAIRAPDPVVLLIDEVDRLDAETEALLLEVLSDYQVSIPEFGTVTSTQTPLVFLTSNNSRELSEALKRRCLYLYIDYPAPERERDIVLSRVPGLDVALAGQIAGVVRSLRQLELKKRPSVSETHRLGPDAVPARHGGDQHRPGHRHPARAAQAPVGHREGHHRAQALPLSHDRQTRILRCCWCTASPPRPNTTGGCRAGSTCSPTRPGDDRRRPARPRHGAAASRSRPGTRRWRPTWPRPSSGREPLDAIGFSAGAQVLLRLAADQPGRFRRLALLGIGGGVLEPADPEPIVAALTRRRRTRRT